MTRLALALAVVLYLAFTPVAAAAPTWPVETFTFESRALKDNKLDLDLTREVWVWLPPDYATSNKRYPVIHYIHNYAWSAQQMHEVERIGETFQRAYARGQTEGVIFVVGDYRATHSPGTFCGNNAVVGRWWDYTSEELVTQIDRRYRTLATPQSRGISGDYTGGYCAIRLAMERPGVFSSVYALHPVGTGQGSRVMHTIADWQMLNAAKNYQDLANADGYTRAFLLMAQSHAPNPNNPPFYADFMMRSSGDTLVEHTGTITRIRNDFLLINRVENHVQELKALRGFMFDWGRYDPNPGHVEGNRRFTSMLNEYAIPHYAEEHRGNDWSEKWVEYGRVEDRMLPFFKRYLERP